MLNLSPRLEAPIRGKMPTRTGKETKTLTMQSGEFCKKANFAFRWILQKGEFCNNKKLTTTWRGWISNELVYGLISWTCVWFMIFWFFVRMSLREILTCVWNIELSFIQFRAEKFLEQYSNTSNLVNCVDNQRWEKKQWKYRKRNVNTNTNTKIQIQQYF